MSPLDEAHERATEALGRAMGLQAPEPYSDTVRCLVDALRALVDQLAAGDFEAAHTRVIEARALYKKLRGYAPAAPLAGAVRRCRVAIRHAEAGTGSRSRTWEVAFKGQ